MPKKKNSIALFEVIQKSRRSEANMEVPKWMTGSPAPTGGPAEATPPPPAPPPTPVAAPGAAPAAQRTVQVGPRSVPAVASVSLAPAAPAAPATAGALGRLRALSGKAVSLSLTYPVCAAVAGGVLVLLIASFALGRWSGSRPEPAAQAGGLPREHVPLNKDVLGAAKPGPVGKGGAAAAVPTTRAKGKWFLVIQQLKDVTQAEYDEAVRIADFCKKEGCPATVAKYTPAGRTGKQKYIVWSLTPFDSGDSAPGKAYAGKIEEIGKTYFAKHHTYQFRQKTAGGRFDPWFEQQR